MVDRLSIFGESGGAIWHDSLSLECSDLWAQVGLLAHAEDAFTFAALWGVARDDRVAHLN